MANNSNLTDLANVHILHPPGYYERALQALNISLGRHFDMLTNVISGADDIRPLVYMSSVPVSQQTPNAISQGPATQLFDARYEEIDHQLTGLASSKAGEAPAVEFEAIETARAVITGLRQNAISPPAISWLSSEAVVMLWGLGETRYALTITDGEIGYVVKEAARTTKRKSGIPLPGFDVYKLAY